MADGGTARPSTDDESAPLLRDPERVDSSEDGVQHANGQSNKRHPKGFKDRMAAMAHEPLTPLTKLLLVLLLLFLLLSSVFIGLFAGVQHKLNAIGGGAPEEHTETLTLTKTETRTATATATTTATSVRTTIARTTATLTTTDHHTDTSTVISTSTTTKARTTTITTTTKVPVPPSPKPTGEPNPPEQSELCLDPSCVILSASILSSLDITQDPCENFYDFATGGWRKEHPVSADKGLYGVFNQVAENNERIIRTILESNFTVESTLSMLSVSSAPSYTSDEAEYDAQILGKLRGLYQSCLNEEVLDARGQAPLVAVIETVRKLYRGESTDIGAIVAEPGSREALTAAVVYLHSRGIPALFSLDVEGDVGRDPNFMTLWFSQPELGLPSKEYYEEQSIVDLYQSVLERLLATLEPQEDALLVEPLKPTAIQVNFAVETSWPPWPWPPWDGDDDDGGDDDDPDPEPEPEPAPKPPKPTPDPEPEPPKEPKPKPRPTPPKPRLNATELAKGVVAFEVKLAKASLDLDVLYQDPFATYNPTSFYKFTDALPQIDFPTYIAAYTPRNFPERVIVTYPPYVTSLARILSETSTEIVEAYLITRAALALSPNLGSSTEAWQAQRTLEETLKGIKKGAVGDRAEICTSVVEENLGFAAGRYYVNETFGGESREKGTKVITDIISAFKKSLREIDWMDEESADAATQKADALRVKVGFPIYPNTLSARAIAYYYYLVEIREDTYFENLLSAAKSDKYKAWQFLGKQREKDAWEMYPSQVNAYFNPPANEIVFPAGILQPPFFQESWPHYLYYGAFGHVAAHELTHAFDSAGRLYNQNGKLEEWWTNATSEAFNVRQECLSKQYSSYWVDDGKGGRVFVNGNLTSGENIGDSGLIQAYRAWKAQYDESYDAGDEYLLPGLNYTRDQLFFISFARAWAQNIKPAAAVQRVRTDPHSPNRFRVDGTLSNIPEFAKVFKCSAKAKLNPPPEKRCLLWS